MKLLVAGIGNIFFGDDGFGPAVARALGHISSKGVKIEDYGIRGIHLAYELLAGYDCAVLIDAVSRGEMPGTLYVIEPELSQIAPAPDAHRMDVENVLAFIRTIGGEPPPITLIGCEPASTEPQIGLSEPVQDAVQPAAQLVARLIESDGRLAGAAPRLTVQRNG